MIILVDSDIIIDYLRVSNKQSTQYYKIFIERENTAYISFITVIELFAGREMDNPKKKKVIENIIEKSLILGATKEFYNLAGEILRHNIINFQDGLIAAHAILYNFPLLTKNKKDFAKIKGIKFFSAV